MKCFFSVPTSPTFLDILDVSGWNYTSIKILWNKPNYTYGQFLYNLSIACESQSPDAYTFSESASNYQYSTKPLSLCIVNISAMNVIGESEKVSASITTMNRGKKIKTFVLLSCCKAKFTFGGLRS